MQPSEAGTATDHTEWWGGGTQKAGKPEPHPSLAPAAGPPWPDLQKVD